MNEKKIVIIIFVISLLIRSIYIYIYYDPDFLKKGDSLQYLTYANEILSQGICVENINVKNDIAGKWSIIGPGYPLIIAVSLLIFGNNYFPVFLFNALLTSLIPIVLYYLTKELIKNIKLAYIVAIWGIININYIKFTPFLLKEPVVYLLLPLTIILIVRESRRGEKITKNIIFAVLTFSFLIHTDERYLAYFPFFIVPFFLVKQELKIKIKRSVFWIAAVLFLMTPWLIRNYFVFSQVVVLTERTTKLSSVLWGKDYTDASINSAYHNVDGAAVVDSIKKGLDVKSISLDDKKYLAYAIERGIIPHQYTSFEKYYYGIINFWRPVYFSLTFINTGFRPEVWSIKHNLVSLLIFGIFLPFYFCGLIYLILLGGNKLLLFVGFLPFIQMIVHVMLVHVLERYRSPIDFIVVIIGLWFAKIILEKSKIIKSSV